MKKKAKKRTKISKPRAKASDHLDWVIRTLRAEGFLTMRQMILILRCWSKSIVADRALTNEEVREIAHRYQAKVGSVFLEDAAKDIVTASDVVKAIKGFKSFVPFDHVVAMIRAQRNNRR